VIMNGAVPQMAEFSLRELMRRSGLSQKALSAILPGKAVRQRTLAILMQVLAEE